MPKLEKESNGYVKELLDSLARNHKVFFGILEQKGKQR